LQGETKKLKPPRYGSFDIIEKANENSFRLKLPPYMYISLVVNVEYLNLFEPSMLYEEEDRQFLPIFEYFTLHTLEELKEDIVLQCKE
jgi:hypothetical protein